MDVTTKFDAVFWCGDLNFRILNDRDHIHDAVEGLKADGSPNFQNLVQHDELFRAMNEGKVVCFTCVQCLDSVAATVPGTVLYNM